MTERPERVSGDPHDLVAGYLLDALDAPELARFVAHLPSCAACRAELAAAGADGRRPGHHGRGRTPRSARGRPDGCLVRARCSPSPIAPVQVAAPTHPLGRARRSARPATLPSQCRSPDARRRRRWMWPAAAAAAFVLGIGVAASTHPFDAPDDQPSAAAAEMQQIMEVTAAPDAHLMALDVPGATTRLVLSNDMDMGAVLASDLPMPAKGREYHLWTMMDDETVQIGCHVRPRRGRPRRHHAGHRGPRRRGVHAHSRGARRPVPDQPAHRRGVNLTGSRRNGRQRCPYCESEHRPEPGSIACPGPRLRDHLVDQHHQQRTAANPLRAACSSGLTAPARA